MWGFGHWGSLFGILMKERGRGKLAFGWLLALPLVAACGTRPGVQEPDAVPDGRIQPYAANPHYLAWGEVPIFPLGATGHHSWTPISRPGTVDFIEQLDRLARTIDEIGSPHLHGFVRCMPYDPMNHMHDGEVERVLQPWVRLEDGRYDLERFEPAWEERLRAYLDAALERRIVVSLELWDDWSVTRGPGGQYDPGEGGAWNAHPFNPGNNVNYDEDVLPATTAVCEAPFYRTIPARDHIEPVLTLQKRYADRVLEIVSGYPNVILNLSNESRAHLDWSRFWARYVRGRIPGGPMIGEMPSTNRRDGGGECENDFGPLALSTDPFYDLRVDRPGPGPGDGAASGDRNGAAGDDRDPRRSRPPDPPSPPVAWVSRRPSTAPAGSASQPRPGLV